MPLQAGVATVDITPPVGTPLAGFAARDHGSEGLHDPLYSKALVLDNGVTRVCLITNDLLNLSADLVGRIREQIERETGLPGDHVMVNCSHTHSGPQLKDEGLAAVVARQIAGGAVMAHAALQPARLGASRGPVQVGINRREMRDGQMILGRNPEGPVAPYVDVVRVDDAEGRPLAILFAHAAHAVTRGGDSYLISADYPGRAQAVVQQVHPGAVAMFAQGCSGNINCDAPERTWEDVRRLGTMLAGEVLKVREEIATTDEVKLAALHEPSSLPCQRLPQMAKIEAELADCERKLAEAEASGAENNTNMARAFRDTWVKLKGMKERGEELPPYDFPLQGLRIGDVAVLGLPGEVFVDYQLHANAVSPFRQTLTLGCTNGSGAYIPTAAALDEGGYEVTFTPIWWGRLPFAPEAETVLRDSIERLLQRLHAAG
ncbi:neutral/alkaline non-lysosomal ceramidase N-terminal domain-containing protein [bacterium]|nr:neutral/alkaline non-lysosomal ceramidase N-terminal domain-containing protein [bacterium]